jgi:hypothetical protein
MWSTVNISVNNPLGTSLLIPCGIPRW